MDKHSHHSMPSRLSTQLYITIPNFTLESGESLHNVVVAFIFHGLLNKRRDNAVVVCHALSGSAVVEEWWPSLVTGNNPVLDPNKYCVICCNSLGSPYGSSSPVSYPGGKKKCSDSKPYGPAFPKTTIRDDIRAQKYVLDILGVRSIQCVIGPSMGGMVALEWSFYGHEYVRALVLIATAARQGAWQLAWNENQRNTIKCDGKYRDGWYGDDPPLAGLAAARTAALMTYRSHYSFEKRFGRRLGKSSRRNSARMISYVAEGSEAAVKKEPSESPAGETVTTAAPPPTAFSVQSYLRYHGKKFNDRFDANCYLHILDKMDTHDITRGRCSPDLAEEEALKRVLGRIRQPTLVVGIPTDVLYPIQEQQILYENIPNTVFGVIESHDGHDGFLIETAQLNNLVRKFFDRLSVGEIEASEQAIVDARRDAVIVWAGSF